jgi:hypothetical protein
VINSTFFGLLVLLAIRQRLSIFGSLLLAVEFPDIVYLALAFVGSACLLVLGHGGKLWGCQETGTINRNKVLPTETKTKAFRTREDLRFGL